MMMMTTPLPGYNSLPALPASNYNYGARPANTANPEYGSAWKTATAIPTAYNNASQYNNTRSTVNNNAQTNQYDGRSYTDNSRYAYNPTANTASQYNNAYSNVDNKLNQFDGRSYAYNPTSNNATQNTQYNNDLKQYLSQIDNRQLNQAQYNQNNTANTAIDYNTYLQMIANKNIYNFPTLPGNPSYPPVTPPVYPPVTPEPPKHDGGGFPWLPVGLGVAALAALFFFNKGGDKPHETTPPPVTPTPHPVKPPEEPPVKPPVKPPVTPTPHPHPDTPDVPDIPPTVHGTATGGVFGDPEYYYVDRSQSFYNHTTGKITYLTDRSDGVHAEITVKPSKVPDGNGNELTFVEEFKFQNDGKTVKITNKEVHIGNKVYSIEGEGSADLGRDGKVTWHNGTVTIETAEGKHVIKTKKFEMEANKHAYGPSYLEIDSTSTSKELDVSGVVGDGMNAQLAGFAPPSKFLRSIESFVDASPEALTKEQMESILGKPSTRTSETIVASSDNNLW